MDKRELVEKLKKYAELVTRSLNVKKIILYGSYARGNFSHQSDIDIAIIVDSIEGDFLDNEAALYRLRRGVDDRIEPVLLEENNDHSGFLSEITKYGKIVYDRKAA